MITNFSANDTLQLTDGAITSHYALGSDYVVNVEKSAAITLGGASSHAIYVVQSDETMITLQASVGAELMPAVDDYWFEQDSDVNQSPFEEIIAVDNPVNLNYDRLSEEFKPQKFELANSARHRKDRM